MSRAHTAESIRLRQAKDRAGQRILELAVNPPGDTGAAWDNWLEELGRLAVLYAKSDVELRIYNARKVGSQ